MNEQTEREMTPIEEKFLKGVTLRIIATIIVSCVTTCTIVVGTYYQFKSEMTMTGRDVASQGDDIKDMKNTQRGFQNDLQLQKLQLNTQDVRLNEMEKRLNK